MVVECDNCHTKFNLDETKLPPDGAWVRCSNCQNVFEVVPEGDASSPPPPPAPPAEWAAAPPPPEAKQPPAAQDDEKLDFDLGDLGGGKDLGLGEGDVDLEADFDLEGEGGLGGSKKSGSGLGKIFKLFFWLVALVVILAVLAGGGLIVMNRMNMAPEIVDRFRDLPGLSIFLAPAGGPGMTGKEQPGAMRMVLMNVQGYFRNNSNVGRIFIIQGMVENQHADTRASVLVRGQLQDAKGQVVRQAVVYAGPSFTPEELRDMPLNNMQARLGKASGPDGSNYVVTPAGTIPFMIVFANLPNDLSGFTAEVVSSQAQTPAQPGS